MDGEETLELLTVTLDVHKISWHKQELGRYSAATVVTIPCPCCENVRDMKYNLEAPLVLLTDIGKCRTCNGKLQLEDERIDYRDNGSGGWEVNVQANLVCPNCATTEFRHTYIPVQHWAEFCKSDNQCISLSEESRRNNKVSILFLAADPTDASRLRLGEEFREIQEKLKQAKPPNRFQLELPRLSVRPEDISQALLDVQPHIVHFSGHGASTGALCFENQGGQTHLIQPDTLAALFEQFAHQVNCVLLNACYSQTQAKAIAEHIDYVIGMNQVIGDKAAIAFTIGFYQALGAGRTIEDAYKLGCVQISLQGIPEHLTPVLIKKGQ